MTRSEFQKEIHGNVKFLRRWTKELHSFNHLSEAEREYQLKQMRNVAQAIYSAHVDLVNVLDKYSKEAVCEPR